MRCQAPTSRAPGLFIGPTLARHTPAMAAICAAVWSVASCRVPRPGVDVRGERVGGYAGGDDEIGAVAERRVGFAEGAYASRVAEGGGVSELQNRMLKGTAQSLSPIGRVRSPSWRITPHLKDSPAAEASRRSPSKWPEFTPTLDFTSMPTMSPRAFSRTKSTSAPPFSR